MKRAYLKSPIEKVKKGLKVGEYQKVYYISDSDVQDIEGWPEKEARVEAESASHPPLHL